MPNKKHKAVADTTSKPAVDVRQFIEPSFLALSKEEREKLNQEIDHALKEASHDMEKADWKCNDRYLHADVVSTQGGDSDEG